MAKFSMTFHCYQPVYNFGWEIEKAYETAYSPLLSAFEGFPKIKAAFHFFRQSVAMV